MVTPGRARFIRRAPPPLPPPVLAVVPETIVQHEPDASPLSIYGESGAKGTFVEPTVGKALPVDGAVPPLAELSEMNKVDDGNVYWREAIDLSHIHGASLKRRIRVVLENHIGMYTNTLGTIKETAHHNRSPSANEADPPKTVPCMREVARSPCGAHPDPVGCWHHRAQVDGMGKRRHPCP